MSSTQIVLAEPSLRSKNRAIHLLARWWPELVTLAAYAGTVLFTIPHHEPWGDEAQAWQLARSVPIFELIHSHLRYEGHPSLWYVLLSSVIHLGVGYTGLHWLCGLIAIIGVSLLIFFAPFPRIIRLALPFTFFLVYQYAVVARGYVLVPLLLFLIAITWRRSPILVAVLLGLLGNVALHALAISGGLALLYLLERRRGGSLQRQKPFLFAGIILLAFYGFAIWTVWPPADLHFYRPEMGESIYLQLWIKLSRSLNAMAIGIMDPPWLTIPFWIFLWRFLYHRGQAIYMLPVVTLELFSTQYAFLWHAGLAVPTLIAVLWIAQNEDPANALVPRWERTVTASLLAYAIACQIAWATYAVAYDYANPYSPDLATVRFLAPRIQAGDKIAVTPIRRNISQTFAVGLEPYLPLNVFMNREYPYWFSSTKDRTEEAFLEALPSHPPIILVEFAQIETPTRFKTAPDFSGPKVDLLHQNGYALTHVFCGSQPFHLRNQIQICHLIFERKL